MSLRLATHARIYVPKLLLRIHTSMCKHSSSASIHPIVYTLVAHSYGRASTHPHGYGMVPHPSPYCTWSHGPPFITRSYVVLFPLHVDARLLLYYKWSRNHFFTSNGRTITHPLQMVVWFSFVAYSHTVHFFLSSVAWPLFCLMLGHMFFSFIYLTVICSLTFLLIKAVVLFQGLLRGNIKIRWRRWLDRSISTPHCFSHTK